MFIQQQILDPVQSSQKALIELNVLIADVQVELRAAQAHRDAARVETLVAVVRGLIDRRDLLMSGARPRPIALGEEF